MFYQRTTESTDSPRLSRLLPARFQLGGNKTWLLAGKEQTVIEYRVAISTTLGIIYPLRDPRFLKRKLHSGDAEHMLILS